MEAGGVGWVFRKTWASRAGLKKVAKAERVVTVSVDTTGGTLDLHSIYSQSHGDVALGKLREGVWFGDVNDNAPLAGKGGLEVELQEPRKQAGPESDWGIRGMPHEVPTRKPKRFSLEH